MGLLFFPLIGLGFFGTGTGLGLQPAAFMLAMLMATCLRCSWPTASSPASRTTSSADFEIATMFSTHLGSALERS